MKGLGRDLIMMSWLWQCALLICYARSWTLFFLERINEFKIPLKWYEGAKRSFKLAETWRGNCLPSPSNEIHIACWSTTPIGVPPCLLFFHALSCFNSLFIHLSLGSESVRAIPGSWRGWWYNICCQDANLHKCCSKFTLLWNLFLANCL